MLVLSIDFWVFLGLWIGRFSETEVIHIMPLEKSLLAYVVSLNFV